MATLSNWSGDLDLNRVMPDVIANRLQQSPPPASRQALTAPAPDSLLRWRLPASVRRHRSQPFASARRTRS